MKKRDFLIKEFTNKGNDNYLLYEFLKKQNMYKEWQIVALFYSALCYAKAYLCSKKSIEINKVDTHLKIKNYLNIDGHCKRTCFLTYYEHLYNDSRDARYKCKKISDSRVNVAFENYTKIKELLKLK